MKDKVVSLDNWRKTKELNEGKTTLSAEEEKYALSHMFLYVEKEISKGVNLETVLGDIGFLTLWVAAKKQNFLPFVMMSGVVSKAITAGFNKYEDEFDGKAVIPTSEEITKLLNHLRF